MTYLSLNDSFMDEDAVSFGEWQKRQGYRVFHSPSSYWYEAGPLFLQAFPYHWIIQPSESEIKKLLLNEKVLGLRYSAPLSAPEGVASYHVVYSRKSYGIRELSAKARYDVKKGLAHSSVEPINVSRLAEEGWLLRADTLQRQGRTKAESADWWRRLCISAEGLPGFEAWGAVREGRLVAALLAYIQGDCCSILYQQSLTKEMKYGVNNALTYAFVSNVLNRGTIRQVFYGLHSLDAPASVDQFKFRMNFEARYVRQRVVFHPLINFIVNKYIYSIIQLVSSKYLHNSMLSKIEGILRFFIIGQLPLNEQLKLMKMK